MRSSVVALRAVAVVLILFTGLFITPLAEANDFNTKNFVLTSGDFNGDGRTDLFVQAVSPQDPNSVVLTDSSGHPTILRQTWNEGYLGITWNSGASKIYVADFNGDGKADLLVQSLTTDQAWLLLQDANGKFSSITATFSTASYGYSWNAQVNNLVVADFNGDGKADVLMQPLSGTGTIAVLNSNGSSFSVGQTWQNGYMGMRWSVGEAVLVAGDFNGDGKADLIIQAKPSTWILASDPLIPITSWPNLFGVTLANASGQFTSMIQTWGRNTAVDWSPITHRLIVGNFTGHSGSQVDILVQDLTGTGTTWLVTPSSNGMLTGVPQTWTNGSSGLNWSATYNTLVAGDFNGDHVTDLYFQSTKSIADNAIATLTAGTGAVSNIMVNDLGAATAPSSSTTSVNGNSNIVGTVPGQFSVDPTGAANYKIAIQVPPGVHGMQPDLALLYNSRAGVGHLGLGWSLSGLSVITRCGQNMEDDGQWQAPNLTAADHFCLDGQHLVPTPPGSLTNYWSSTGSYEYRTKLATFQRVEATGVAGNGPASFTVYDKTAMTRSYGTVTSELGYDGKTDLMWPVNKITDPQGNYISYVYAAQTTYTSAGTVPVNEYVLTEIDYSNNQGVQVGKVVFNYTSGTGEYFVSAGTGIPTTQLLQSIQVYGPAGQFIRQYNLSYQTSTRTGRPLLQTVGECDPNNNCVAPTTFMWTNSANNAGISNGGTDTPAVINTNQPGGWKTLDLDGDGLLDYVFTEGNTIHVIFGKDLMTDVDTGIAAGQGTLHLNNAVVADFYGNGKQELLIPSVTGSGGCASTPDYYLMIAWQNGQVVVDNNYKLIAPVGALPGGSTAPNEYEGNVPVAIDVDGKGLPSLFTKNVLCSDSNNPEMLWFWHNNGHGWDAPVQTNYSFGNGDNAIIPVNLSGKGYGEFYVDHCGTNQTVCRPGGFYTWNNGSLQSISYDFYNSVSPNNPMFLDANGDGLTDAVIATNGQWCFFLNIGIKPTGNNWSPSPVAYQQASASNCVTLDTEHANVAVALDYFGDGRQDMMVPVPDANNVMHWYAIRLDPVTGTPLTPVDTGIVWDGNIYDIFADANGDGQPDYIVPSSTYQNVTINYNNNSTPELLGQIQTINSAGQSLGSTTVVHYLSLPLANAAGWTLSNASPQLDSGAAAPQYRPFMGPVPLVVEYLIDSGYGSGSGTQWLYTYYRYGAPEMDTWGRGFLGFSDLQSINENIGLMTETLSSQGVLTAGMVLSSTQSQIPAGELTSISSPITTTTGANCKWTTETEGAKTIHVRDCSYGNAGYSGFPTLTGLQTITQTLNAPPTPSSTISLSQGGTFAYSPSSVTNYYELGATTPYKTITTTPTYVQDPSGNNAEATDIKVEATTSAGDDYKVDTQSTYNEYVGTWCLGRVATSTVTDTWTPSGASSTVSPPHTASFNYSNCMVSEEDSSVLPPSNAPAGIGASSLTKVYGFDSYGNIQSTTVSGTNSDGSKLASRASSIQYDTNGLYPVAATNALGQTSTATWDPRFGVKTSTTDANGLTTATSYDSFGRKLGGQGILPAQQTAWTYNWCGSGVSCVNSNSVYAYTTLVNSEAAPGNMIPSSVTEYDRLGRAIFTTAYGLNGVPTYQATYYDVMSRAYLTSQPYQWNGTVCWDYKVYDILSRVTNEYQATNAGECSSSQVIAPGAAAPSSYTRDTVYGYSGLTTTVTRGIHATTTVLNGLGKTGSFTDGNDKTTTYGYDAWGNVASVQDATGQNVSTVISDSAGNKLKLVDPDMGTWLYTYDALGELLTQFDPNEAAKSQAATAMKYDLLGRMIERDEPEGASTWKYDIAYGAGIGKLAYETGPNNYWEGYAYNGYGSPTDKITVANGQEYWVSTLYDNFGQVAQVVYPNLTALNVSAAPSTPSGLTVTTCNLTCAATLVSWTNSANGAIYHLYRTPSGVSAPSSTYEIYSGPDASFDDTGITANGTYTWWLQACNGTTCSSSYISKSQAITLPPQVPQAPSVPGNDTHQTSITITWTAVAMMDSTSPEPVGYKLFESIDGKTYSQVYPSSGTTTATSAPVTLSTDGTYYFKLIACTSNNYCSLAGPPSIYTTYLQPTVPQSFTTSQASFNGPPATYTLRWAAPATGTAVNYQLFEALNNNGWMPVSLASPNSTSSPAITRSVTGTYSYEVQACDGTDTALCGPFATITVTINNVSAPPVPTITAPTSEHDGQVFSVSWSDTSTQITSYTVYSSYRTLATWTPVGPGITGGSGFTSQSFTMGNEYKDMSFYVTACTSGGCSSSSTVIVNNPDNSAPGGSGGGHYLVMPPDGHRSLSDIYAMATHGQIPDAVGRAVQLASASPAVEYAPMPKWAPIARRAHRTLKRHSGIVAVDPKLSAYPPLRHDSRIWSHYAAQGGTAPGWVQAASCGSNSGCSETAGSYALMVGYAYDDYGHLVDVTRLDSNGNPQYNYWYAQQANARGEITQEAMQVSADNANTSISISRAYDEATGLVTCINAAESPALGTCNSGLTGSGVIQSDGYQWDMYGNLQNRGSAITGLNETLGYDNDSRLNSITTQLNGATVVTDAPSYKDQSSGTPGDIAARNGATYSYPNPGLPLPHAVSSIKLPNGTTRNFAYDADGNLLSESGDVNRILTWYSYNKPATIGSGAVSEAFSYGPDHDRYQRVDHQSNGDVVTTMYVGGVFEAQSDSLSGTTTYRNYIMAGTEVVAVDSFQGTAGNAASETVNYYFHDHLGEVEAVSNNAGQQVVQYSYDAWGKARPASGSSAFVTPVWGTCNPSLAGRHAGYGTHENIDDECVVHMEGRVYDPEMGRFLSADPTMQDPISTQGYDRYGYIQDNPLSGIDPDGYHFHDIAPYAEAVLYSTGNSYCIAAAVAIAAVDGYQEGGLGMGLRTAGFSVGEAYAMNYIGGKFPGADSITTGQIVEKALIEATVGGLFTVAGGGRFGDGFLGGFAGSIGGNFIDPGDGTFASNMRAVVEAYIVGGTAAKLGGGNFANGGQTAAFIELFNDLRHSKLWDSQDRKDLDAIAHDPKIQKAIDEAWTASNPHAGTDAGRKEHAFWILRDDATKALSVIDVSEDTATNHSIIPGDTPAVDGKTVVAYFHTHPNPHFDGDITYDYGPSTQDMDFSAARNMPLIILARDGIHFYGPLVPP